MAIAHQPTVLILDEPSSGIAQRETEALGPLLLRIKDEVGCALLVIEHDMPLITGIADRLIALELGRVIADGTPAGGRQPPAGRRVLPRHQRGGDRPLRNFDGNPTKRTRAAVGAS